MLDRNLRVASGVSEANGDQGKQDTVLLFGGLSLIVMGAGLVLAHPGLRKMAVAGVSSLLPELEAHLSHGISGVLPDFERYLKIRAM